MYVNGYRVYKENGINHRKGVAILINSDLDLNAMKVNVDAQGRYVKIRITDNTTGDKRSLVSIYIEPGREGEYESLIPESIKNANIIAGDLNRTETPLEKIGVYHLKNMKLIKEIKLNKKILDHPIIITEIAMNTSKLNIKKQIRIIGKSKAKSNMNALIESLTHQKEGTIIDPSVYITVYNEEEKSTIYRRTLSRGSQESKSQHRGRMEPENDKSR